MKFKIKMLEAYEVEIEVDGDTPDMAKLAAADITGGVLDDFATAPIGGTAKLAWRQFKAVAPVEDKRGANVKGRPHASKQKGER